MDIYKILKSKYHNKHYIDRYYKFILYCLNKNINLPNNTYIENHHICPRSKDLFPEYENLKIYPENSIKLTARQHFIAHWILHKAFNLKSTHDAFWMMCHVKDKNQQRYFKLNSNSYQSLKEERSKLVAKQMSENNPSKQESVKEKRRISAMGNTYGKGNKGKPKSEEHKMNMSESRKGKSTSTEKHKKTVSESNKRRISQGYNTINFAIEATKVKCFCEGVVYESIVEAQKHYKGIKVSNRLDNPRYPEFYRIKKY